MKAKAVNILKANRLMAISTLRPNGWPQCTMVSHANEDVLAYFLVSRRSQKFANIREDDRVSLAIGSDFDEPSAIRALSIAGRAFEVRDPRQRARAISLVLERRPALSRFGSTGPDRCAVMRVKPEIITVLDYSKGIGHSDVLTVGAGNLVMMTPARDPDWGFATDPREAEPAVPERAEA